ncbi:MAG: ATP-dependent sacrificial sulfur transferase LarE [Eubacteriales bacterium]|nr:ATP-dependent sacrificial sulfur transferase LarE [Eubacteriales bacterium]
MRLTDKINGIKYFFGQHRKCALAFSGGVDSSFLLYVGLQFGADIRPYYIKTAFQPAFEFNDATATARLLGINNTVLYADILSVPRVATNPSDRCYCCKQAIFKMIIEKAAADGYTLVIDGTNASDDAADRPGMRALKELSVVSPLRACGFTKKEIRAVLREAGLSIWDKPAYSCLATRIDAGNIITAEMLSRVEKAEETLFSLGFSDFRVRINRDAARLQFTKAQADKANDMKTDIINRLKPFLESINPKFEIRVSHE